MVNLVNRDPEGITVKGTMLFLYATDAIYRDHSFLNGYEHRQLAKCLRALPFLSWV